MKLAKAIDFNGELLGKVADKVSFGHIQATYSGITKSCSPGIKPEEVLGVVNLLERIEKHHLKLAQDNSRKKREQWLEKLLSKGQGGAHKFANQPNSQVVPLIKHGESVLDAQQRVAKDWADEWECRNTQRAHEALDAVRYLRDTAAAKGVRENVIEAINLDSLNRALAKFSDDTSTGLGGLTIKSVKHAPKVAKLALVEVLKGVVRDLALPVQSYMQLMAILGKKGWGHPLYSFA